MNILITGANGQLGNEMRRVSRADTHHYIFTDVAELDITNLKAIRETMTKHHVNVIVNCAAYTNVDKAEDDFAMADLLNRQAVENLATAAKEVGATLIHISTDYVFQGDRNIPCKEDWETDSLGVYGRTKLAGEQVISQIGCKYLYSECFFHFCLVQYREMGAFHSAGKLIAVARLNITICISAKAGYFFGKIVPGTYTFIAKMIDSFFVQLSRFYYVYKKFGKIMRISWSSHLIEYYLKRFPF